MHLLQISQVVPRVDGRGASDAVPHTRDGAGCHTGGLALSLVCKSTANSTSRQSNDLIFVLFVANLSGLQIIINAM